MISEICRRMSAHGKGITVVNSLSFLSGWPDPSLPEGEWEITCYFKLLIHTTLVIYEFQLCFYFVLYLSRPTESVTKSQYQSTTMRSRNLIFNCSKLEI